MTATGIFLLLVFFLLSITCGEAFVWPLNRPISYEYPLRITEGYMFKSNSGPFFMQHGESYIEIDAVVKTYSHWNRTARVYVMFYATDIAHNNEDVPGICDSNIHHISNLGWVQSPDLLKVQTKYVSHRHVEDTSANINGTYFELAVNVKHHYPVSNQGWHNLIIKVCDGIDRRALSVTSMLDITSSYGATTVDGSVSFHNPYGFLPAELSGLLPFEVIRILAYLLCFVFYITFYILNYENVVNIHSALLFVFILALIEASLWCASFFYINATGVLYW